MSSEPSGLRFISEPPQSILLRICVLILFSLTACNRTQPATATEEVVTATPKFDQATSELDSIIPSQTLQPPTSTATPTPSQTSTLLPVLSPIEFSRVFEKTSTTCGSVSPSGTFIAIQEFSQTSPVDLPDLALWDTQAWTEVWRKESFIFCASLEFSRDENLVAYGIYAAGLNETIIVYLINVSGGSPERGTVSFYDAVDLSFSHDNQYLAVANSAAVIYQTGNLRLFSNDGVLTANGSDRAFNVWTAASGYIHALDFSPVDHLLAVGTTEDEIYLWDVHDSDSEPQFVNRIECESEAAGIESMVFSPDGSTLAISACGGAAIVAYDLFQSEILMREPATDSIYALAFSPDQSMLAYADGGYVMIRHVESNTILCTLDANDEVVIDAGFTLDGVFLIGVTNQGAVIKWQLERCGN